MILARELDDPIAFPVVNRDGREGRISLVDPPESSPADRFLSQRRERLRQAVADARREDADSEFAFVMGQVIDGIDAYLREHGDVDFSPGAQGDRSAESPSVHHWRS